MMTSDPKTKNLLYKVFITLALCLLGYGLSALYASNRRLRALPERGKMSGGDPLARETVRSKMGGGETINWNGVRIEHHELGRRAPQEVYRKVAAAAIAEGWQEEPLPDEFKEQFPNTRVIRKDDDFRIFLDMSSGPGAPAYLLELFMDGSLADDFDAENFSLESFLGLRSQDLPGIPAPEGGERFFSLLTSGNSGMVSYLFDEGSESSVFEKYLEKLETLGWNRAHLYDINDMTMLIDKNEMCLVGWNPQGMNGKPLITVMRHGF